MDFKAISIDDSLYTVNKENYRDLTEKIIPSLPEIFTEKVNIKVVDELKEGMTVKVISMNTLMSTMFNEVKLITAECNTKRLVLVRNTRNPKVYFAYFTIDERTHSYTEDYCRYYREYYELENYPGLAKLSQIMGFTDFASHRDQIRRRMLGLEELPDYSNIMSLIKTKDRITSDIDRLKELICKIYAGGISVIDINMLMEYKLIECSTLSIDRYTVFRAMMTDIDPDKKVVYDGGSKCITVS